MNWAESGNVRVAYQAVAFSSFVLSADLNIDLLSKSEAYARVYDGSPSYDKHKQ
jgi:hypothetical protein